MVNWLDPAVIATTASVYSKFMTFLFGLYVWELFTTIDFELSFIGRPSRRRKWKAHYITYFVCRYAFLVAIVLINVILNVTKPVNCQALFIANQLFGNISIGTASLNLLLRTTYVWLSLPSIVYPLWFMALVHWGLLLYNTTTISAHWDFQVNACIYSGAGFQWILALYVYTMIFDGIILVCCFVRLRMRPLEHSGGIWNMIWRDGVVYFVTAFLANALAVVFLGLNLNPPAAFLFCVPSACLCSIVSCRAVIRLTGYGPRDPTNPNSSGSSFQLPKRPYGSARFHFDIKNGKRKDPGGLSRRDSSTERKPKHGGLFKTNPDTLPSAIYAKTILDEDQINTNRERSVDEYGHPTTRLKHGDDEDVDPATGAVISQSSGDSAPSTPIPWTQKKPMSEKSRPTTGGTESTGPMDGPRGSSGDARGESGPAAAAAGGGGRHGGGNGERGNQSLSFHVQSIVNPNTTPVEITPHGRFRANAGVGVNAVVSTSTTSGTGTSPLSVTYVATSGHGHTSSVPEPASSPTPPGVVIGGSGGGLERPTEFDPRYDIESGGSTTERDVKKEGGRKLHLNLHRLAGGRKNRRTDDA